MPSIKARKHAFKQPLQNPLLHAMPPQTQTSQTIMDSLQINSVSSFNQLKFKHSIKLLHFVKLSLLFYLVACLCVVWQIFEYIYIYLFMYAYIYLFIWSTLIIGCHHAVKSLSTSLTENVSGKKLPTLTLTTL